MRTTITIDDTLLADVKRVAADSGRTVGRVIEDALRESLARPRHEGGAHPVELPTFKGGGWLQPGVDLDDSAALLELMERDDRPH